VNIDPLGLCGLVRHGKVCANEKKPYGLIKASQKNL